MSLDDMLLEPELVHDARRWFFERLTAGLFSPEEIRAYAQRLDLDLEAEAWAIVLLDLPPEPREAAAFFTDPAGEVRGRLLAFFLKYAEYMPFLLGPTLCAVVVKADAGQMDGLIRRCTETVRREYAGSGLNAWHLAASSVGTGLEQLPALWEEVSRLWAWRYIRPEQNVFLAGTETPPPAPPAETAGEPQIPAETAPAAHTGSLDRAAAYIREHFAETDLTLARTAGAVGLTPGYLSALFRQKTGETFTQYLTGQRMEAAKHLLRTSRLPAGQVARAAGFRDGHYFSALFKKIQGCTPTQYRAEFKE